MRVLQSLSILLSLSLKLTNADLIESAMASLPSCALNCMVKAISVSPCSLSNTTCIATNEALNTMLTTCVKADCTIKESLTTKNFSESAFGAPIRDRTKGVSVIGLTGGALTLLAVMLRLMARLPCCGGQFGLDDWAIIVAMLPVLPLTGLSVVLANEGLGKDMWTVPFDKITHILHIYYFDESFYLSSLALTKISILLFYLRIFPDRGFRRSVYFTMACCAAYIIAFIPITVFQCRPINLAWKRWDGEHKGNCINLNAEGWTASGFNIALDIATIVLPLRPLSKLALSRRKKIGIMFMFTLGFFVTVISMLRLKWMIQFANTQNVTWDYVPIGYWSTIEVHVGIICACLPALRALQFRIFPSTKRPSQYEYYPPSKKPSQLATGASSASMVARPKGDTRDFVQLDDISVETTHVVTASKGDRTSEVRTLGGGKGLQRGASRIVVKKEFSVSNSSAEGETFFEE
ncbi:hypothetical protein AOQ84DRAFT_155692 [Glonium stellatum]|uniref:CFEM domain-containing protein n=1 Tax=Glonium stellatum TaxID=574774 RepID=A0A8E2JWN9_9PEZI|nr:hypothetical protein AOQ84DRAFT_155692 [Glonium stellatum]